MKRTGQEAGTALHSQRGREAELTLRPSPWQLPAVHSPAGYSSGGQGSGCHV